MGAVVGLPSPRSDWNQTDERKADYIKNKPTVYQLQQELGIVGINTILSELHFNRVPALEENKASKTYVDSAISVAIGEALEGDY